MFFSFSVNILQFMVTKEENFAFSNVRVWWNYFEIYLYSTQFYCGNQVRVSLFRVYCQLRVTLIQINYTMTTSDGFSIIHTDLFPLSKWSRTKVGWASSKPPKRVWLWLSRLAVDPMPFEVYRLRSQCFEYQLQLQ